MRDICTESVVPVIPAFMDKLIKYILFACIGASVLLFLFVSFIGLLLGIVFIYLLCRHLSKTDSEYEYVHTNNILDVDLVTCNSMRKQLCTINLDQVDIVAPADSEDILLYGSMKQTDYSGNADSPTLYAVVYTDNGKKQKLLLHLDEQMRKSLKQWIPGKVK